MGSSDEHTFISQTFVETVSELSRSRLYGFQEADRARFDFSCNVQQSHRRVLVGQTLWGNFGGIWKDVLLLEGAEAPPLVLVYLFRDTPRAQSKIDEVVQHGRRAGRGTALIRAIPITPEFRVDDEGDRQWLQGYLRRCISSDIVLRIVLGDLGPEDVWRFQFFANIPGMNLAILDAVSEGVPPNGGDLADALHAAKTTTASKLNSLIAAGYLSLDNLHVGPLSAKGHALRDVAVLLTESAGADTPDPPAEFSLICDLLGMSVPQEWPDLTDLSAWGPVMNTFTPEARGLRLLLETHYARRDFARPLHAPDYTVAAPPGSDRPLLA